MIRSRLVLDRPAWFDGPGTAYFVHRARRPLEWLGFVFISMVGTSPSSSVASDGVAINAKAEGGGELLRWRLSPRRHIRMARCLIGLDQIFIDLNATESNAKTCHAGLNLELEAN